MTTITAALAVALALPTPAGTVGAAVRPLPPGACRVSNQEIRCRSDDADALAAGIRVSRGDAPRAEGSRGTCPDRFVARDGYAVAAGVPGVPHGRLTRSGAGPTLPRSHPVVGPEADRRALERRAT